MDSLYLLLGMVIIGALLMFLIYDFKKWKEDEKDDEKDDAIYKIDTNKKIIRIIGSTLIGIMLFYFFLKEIIS